MRLRAGYNPTPDWLLFITGGLAYGRSEYNFSFAQPGAANNFPPSPTTYALRQSSTDIGYAVGVGGEYKLNRNWSVKGEYLFVDLGTRTINTFDIDGAPFRASYAVRDHIGKYNQAGNCDPSCHVHGGAVCALGRHKRYRSLFAHQP